MSDFELSKTEVPAGLSVIEASAGTGKTWTIAHLVPRLLIDGKLDKVDQALLVTFTEDAARELGERVRRQLAALVELVKSGEAAPADEPGLADLLARLAALSDEKQALAQGRLLNALEDSDHLSVSTIHSFCHAVLADQAFLCGMPAGFAVMTETRDLKQQVLADLWRQALVHDPLLADLAALEGWSLDADLSAWNLTENLRDLQLHPRPKSLAQVRQDLKLALEALQAEAKALKALAAKLTGPKKMNHDATPEDLLGLSARIKAIHAEQPDGSVLVLAKEVVDVAGLIAARSSLGKALKAEYSESALVRAAGSIQVVLREFAWAWMDELLTQAPKLAQERLEAANQVTFQGLINKLHGAVVEPPHEAPEAAALRLDLVERLKKRWNLALVDEAQDTDPLQMGIFKAIFDDPLHSLLLIGDPKQAIYSFRGADLDAYLATRSAVDPGRCSSLTKTFRSAQGMVGALNAFFGRLDHPLGNSALPVEKATAHHNDAALPLPEDGLGRLVVALVQPRREAKPLEQEGLGAEGPEAWRQWATASQRNESAAEAVAAAIARVLGKPMGQERVNPGHCAVLTRSGWEARLVQKALSRRHIASVLRESGDVMESDEAAELATVMQAVLKPGKRGWRRAALATRLLGLNAAELACLSPEDEEAWQDRLAAWGDVWAKQGVAAFLAALDNEGGASQNLAQSHEGERRITDLRHLCEMLQAEGSASAGGPEHLLEWLQKAQASIDPVTAKERLRRLEQDSAAVQVLTQHAAKGLEFDLVFCPYLWSVRREKDERVVLRSGMPDKKPALVNLALLDPAARAAMEARVGWERLQEDLRLAYVALTRARRRAWVLAGWPGYAVKNSVVPPSALDWLLQAKPEGPSAGGSAWYSSMKAQKTVDLEAGFTCQQVAVCMDSQAFSQPLFSVASVDLGAAGDTQGQALPLLLKERQAPIATVPEWKLTSYSRLIDGSDQAQDRRDPEQAPVDEDESAERVPLAAFPAGARPGTCLHAVLEAWDFAIEPRELVHKALQDHGFAGPDKNGFDPVAALSTELPKWAKVRLEALDCTLGQAAADKAQSEIPFMLPLQPGGLDLQALAAVFRKHAADDEGRAYADSLLNIAQDQADSLLHGFIDRLLRHGQRWALIDWKSNKQGLCAKDYGPESLRRSAQEHHYVLQAHLYLVALRRFLMRRGQPFELVGGGLAYLRGLQAGTGQGLLWFRPSDAMLHELDALFAQGSLA